MFDNLINSSIQTPLEHPVHTYWGQALASWLVCSTGCGHYVVFLGKVLNSYSGSLGPSVHKSLEVNLMLGVTLWWTRVPPWGRFKYFWSLHTTETRISSSLMGHLVRMRTVCYVP